MNKRQKSWRKNGGIRDVVERRERCKYMNKNEMIEENTCVDTTPKYTLPYLIIISGEYWNLR